MIDMTLRATILKENEWLVIEAPEFAYVDELQAIVEMFPEELRKRVVVLRAIKVVPHD